MTKTDADRITDLETQFAELKQQLADHQAGKRPTQAQT